MKKSKMRHRGKLDPDLTGKRRSQRPVKRRGVYVKREKIGAAVLDQIEMHIRQTAERFNVSRSFVIAVALADFFGIANHERFNG